MIRVQIFNENGLMKEAELSSSSFFLGRSKKVDISLKDNLLSRKHIEFKVEDEKVFIRDLFTTNGTYIDGDLITADVWVEVSENKRVYIGKEQNMFFFVELDEEEDEDDDTNIVELMKTESNPISNDHDQIERTNHSISISGNNALSINTQEQVFHEETEHGVQAMINKVDNDEGTEFSEIELLEIKKIEIDAQVKALKLKDESELEAKRLIDKARQESESMLNSAEDEADEILSSTKREVEKLKNESKKSADKLLLNAKQTSESILESANDKSKELLKRSGQESDELLTHSKKESERILNEAIEESENTLRKANQDAQFELDQAHEKSKTLFREAEDKKEDLINKATREADKITTEAKEEYHRLTRKVEEIYQERNELSEKTRELREDLRNSKDLKSDCDKEVIVLKREIQSLESELSLLKDKHEENLKEFEHRKINLLEQSDELNETITILKKVREDEQNEADRVEKNLFNVREELDSVKAKEDQLVESINKNEQWLEKLYEDKKKLVAENRDVEDKFNKLSIDVSNYESKLAGLNNQIETKEFNLQEIEAKALDFFNKEKNKHEENLRQMIEIDNRAFEEQKEKNYKIAKDIIGKAKYEADLLTKESEDAAIKLEEETTNLLEKTRENETRISILKDSLENQHREETDKLNIELNSIREEAQLEIDEVKRAAQAEAQETKEKALSEYELAVKGAKEKSDEIIEKAQNSADDKIEKAEIESTKLLQLSREELEKVHKQVKETLEFAKNKAKKIEEDGYLALKKKQELVAEHHEGIENELKEIVKKKETIEQEAKLLETNLEQQREKVLAEAKLEAVAIKNSAEELVEEAKKNAESMKQELLDEAQGVIENLQKEADAKAEDKLRKEKNAIAKLRAQEIEKIKELKLGEEKALNDRKIEYADTISRGIQNLVNTNIQEACGKKALEEKIQLELDKIEYLVKTSLLDKNPENNQMLKKLNPYGKKGKGQSAQLMKRLAIGGGVVIFLILLHFIFPGLYSSMTSSVTEQVAIKESAKEMYLKQLKDKEENAPKFEPKMTDAFKGNYTDNLIYTKGYADLWPSDALQKEWTIKVDEIIVYKLELKDYKVIKFISEEFKIIRELNNLRQKIRFATQEQQIAEMKKFEEEKKKILVEILEGEKNYKQMFAEQKKFFIQFRNSNP